MKNQRDHTRHLLGLILALVSVMSALALVGSANVAEAQVIYPSWNVTGNLNTPRYGYTATLLSNGKVLVFGSSELPAPNNAELYDPISGTWSYTGNLNQALSWRTATLLPNGKVLVAGGIGLEGSGTPFTSNSAELYDPATGTWTVTSNLKTGRAYHTATLLPNGKVLVAGGQAFSIPLNYFAELNSAELYDPVTGAWSNTGNLVIRLDKHTATLLQDGRVMVAGGETFDAPGNLNYFAFNAEIDTYDPATGTWSHTGNLSTARIGHTATLLQDGRVLVVAGTNNNNSKSAELYDPATGTCSSTANLNDARYVHTATRLPNGKVLVLGSSLTVELYDPVTGRWTITAYPTGGYYQSATLLSSGKVLAVGGISAELYDPGNGTNSNIIDYADFFVHEHYADFLNRTPDTDGLAYWTNQITSCGADVACNEVKHINVSAAFYLSIEFQETGYLVYRIHKAAYGNLPGAPVPLTLEDFLPDTRWIGSGVIVNEPGWEQLLEDNKQAFILDFVEYRNRFTLAYPTSMSPAELVDTLFAHAEVIPSASDRTAAINEFGSATTTDDIPARAHALRRVAENSTFTQREFNKAFVLMQYFGYLRRNPNDSPEPGLNFDGYNFWLTKLNQFNGNFINAEMVKAFITSTEYRKRFGP